MTIIITHSEQGKQLAQKLVYKGFEAEIHFAPEDYEKLWIENDALIFIGALGICVRKVAAYIDNKKSDPAVINIDVNGQFVQAVLSGHVGGANELTLKLSKLLGATPVITTVSDTSGLWALDLLAHRYHWKMEYSSEPNHLIAAFVNGGKTALLLEARDSGSLFLESSKPDHVTVFYHAKDFNPDQFQLVIALTPFTYDFGPNTIFYRPPVLHLGLGCQRGIAFPEFESGLIQALTAHNIAPASITSLSTVALKKDEPALGLLSDHWGVPLHCYDDKTLASYQVPNPSDKVEEVTGSASVCEAAAMHRSHNSLLVEKTKRKAGDHFFTFSVAFDAQYERKGFVEFVGAGPGDPELVSVKGKRLLQTADYILYAGSLVPEELTHYAKPGCMVESSAGMDRNRQLNSMKAFYERGLFIVRLHTGDPCIYGAIQEQMALMDEWGWSYHITPGISSFQAAAAALQSQFTIPEEVQTIILTRGEGRTPMPEKEHLHKLAQSQSTMCIYLSASIAEKVERELLAHYPPETPVAVCYKLTWKDERIFRCTLETLAQTVKENNLSMTTLIVVGKAIDNRTGESKLYHKDFAHAFRNRQKDQA